MIINSENLPQKSKMHHCNFPLSETIKSSMAKRVRHHLPMRAQGFVKIRHVSYFIEVMYSNIPFVMASVGCINVYLGNPVHISLLYQQHLIPRLSEHCLWF